MHTHRILSLVTEVLRNYLNEFDQSGEVFSALRLDEFTLRHLALEQLQAVRGYTPSASPEISQPVREMLLTRSQTEAT